MSSPYRTTEGVDTDPEPPRPRGCPCAMSPETRAAYAAMGGWWHTRECDEWRAWRARRGERGRGR